MTEAKRPKILWANRYCLLDTSSGASKSAREMLLQLHKRGYEVEIIGATVFDSERGANTLTEQLKGEVDNKDKYIKLKDGPFFHTLVKTKSWHSGSMKLSELNSLFSLYTLKLARSTPDIVWFYGGNSFDLLIPSEAKRQGIATAAYLVNGNYNSARWCEDVDVVITDSQATAGYYAKKIGIHPKPVGTFIPPARYVAKNHTQKNLTFVNPVLQKGVSLVIQLAMAMEKRRPDIQFEIVESRGRWEDALQMVGRSLGQPGLELSNVLVTPNTSDMRPVYERARVILAPSLWWESGSRVLAEAMLNGIPAIITDRGGSPEMIGNGGIRLNLPEELHKKPFKALLSEAGIKQIIPVIERIFDDEEYYKKLVGSAKKTGEEKHNIGRNTDRLIKQFQALLDPERKGSYTVSY